MKRQQSRTAWCLHFLDGSLSDSLYDTRKEATHYRNLTYHYWEPVKVKVTVVKRKPPPATEKE